MRAGAGGAAAPLPVLGPGGLALRVGLPLGGLGFCGRWLRLPAGVVPGGAGLRRFPASLRAVKGLVFACLEIPHDCLQLVADA